MPEQVSKLNVRMSHVAALLGVTVTLAACAHVPLRTFDCEGVLGLRLGQSREEVKALLGEPLTESGYSHWWDETVPVVDYVMWFTDFDTEHWVPSSRDYFWVEFFRNRVVKATAYRADATFLEYGDRKGLVLGSLSYGQPTISTNSPPIPATAWVGPAFDAIFQCRLDARLEKARSDFERQLKAAGEP